MINRRQFLQSTAAAVAATALNAHVAYAQDHQNKFPPNVGATAPPGLPPNQAWYDDDKIGKYLPKYAFPAPGSATPELGAAYRPRADGGNLR